MNTVNMLTSFKIPEFVSQDLLPEEPLKERQVLKLGRQLNAAG